MSTANFIIFHPSKKENNGVLEYQTRLYSEKAGIFNDIFGVLIRIAKNA